MAALGSFPDLDAPKREVRFALPEAVIRSPSSVLRTGLFGQPRFPKTLNKQLCV